MTNSRLEPGTDILAQMKRKTIKQSGMTKTHGNFGKKIRFFFRSHTETEEFVALTK
jgi:hypothetical protein